MLTSLHIIHASYSVPVLSPFPSLYALLFVIHRFFYFIVSTHFHTWLSWKRLNIHTYKVSSPYVLLLVSLRSKERKLPEAILLMVVMETIQVSPPCVLY